MRTPLEGVDILPVNRVLTALALLLVTLMLGCTPSQTGNPAANLANKDIALEHATEVPLLLFYASPDSTMKAKKQKPLFAYWNLTTGNITIKKRLSSSKDYAAFNLSSSVKDDPIWPPYFDGENLVVELRGDKKARQYRIDTVLPEGASAVIPLLVSGDADDFIVLAAYDHPADGYQNERPSRPVMMGGSLLLGEVRGSRIKWSNIKGDNLSFIAGAGSGLAKVGSNIFIDNGGGEVKVLRLGQHPLRLTDYTPANSVLAEVKDKFTEFRMVPMFGSYQDTLLVAVPVDGALRVWALQNDKLVGRLDFFGHDGKLKSYKDDKPADSKTVTGQADAMQLPKDGGVTWR